MSMHAGGGKGPNADINVTPLIDIVLVLLIIFMVLTPMVQRGYDLSIPEKATIDQPIAAATDQIMIIIEKGGQILINKDAVPEDGVRAKLEEILQVRREKMVFFQCDDSILYQRAIVVLDAIRAAGGQVGLVTTEIKPGT